MAQSTHKQFIEMIARMTTASEDLKNSVPHDGTDETLDSLILMAREMLAEHDEVEPFDPQPNDIWDHEDGGSLYVLDRRTGRPRADVKIQDLPFGDPAARPYWIRYKTFLNMVTDNPMPRQREKL